MTGAANVGAGTGVDAAGADAAGTAGADADGEVTCAGGVATAGAQLAARRANARIAAAKRTTRRDITLLLHLIEMEPCIWITGQDRGPLLRYKKQGTSHADQTIVRMLLCTGPTTEGNALRGPCLPTTWITYTHASCLCQAKWHRKKLERTKATIFLT